MRTIVVLGLLFGIAHVACAASGDIAIDCSHFSKQPDGNWRGDSAAMLEVNGSRIGLANTVFSAGSMHIDGVSVYARLERQCKAPAGGAVVNAATPHPVPTIAR